MVKSRFESLGVYLPNNRVTTAEVMRRFKNPPNWDLEKITGIKERRIAKGESSFSMALDAAQNALSMSKYTADDIDLIINTSVTKYYANGESIFEPCQSALVKKALGASKANHFDLSNACAGMFTGVMIANSMIKNGEAKVIMIISGEINTHHYEKALTEENADLAGCFATLTLGDGGAAIIMDESPDERYGLHYLELKTVAEHNDLCVAMPSQDSPGADFIADPVALQAAIVTNLWPFYKDALDQTGWTLQDLDLFIPHQTSVLAINKAKEVIQYFAQETIEHEFVSSVEKYGNTSSTTHSIALHEQIINNIIQPGHNIQFGVFASGVVIGIATYTMDDLPLRYQATHQMLHNQQIQNDYLRNKVGEIA